MDSFDRRFTEARKAQGFASQTHLDTFFALFDHTASCAACKALDGYVMLDDGAQPTSGRCPAARDLDAKLSEVSR